MHAWLGHRYGARLMTTTYVCACARHGCHSNARPLATGQTARRHDLELGVDAAPGEMTAQLLLVVVAAVACTRPHDRTTGHHGDQY